jgi:hypothetical protein
MERGALPRPVLTGRGLGPTYDSGRAHIEKEKVDPHPIATRSTSPFQGEVKKAR